MINQRSVDKIIAEERERLKLAFMSDVFKNKLSWLRFAQEHNNCANVDAIQLNGSQSYTLAAIHLAANIQIPKNVKLDTKRAQGIFVSDHFSGLRKLYESNIESGRWLPSILKKCRDFAMLHSIDSDELIIKLLGMTEKMNQKSLPYMSVPPKPVVYETYDDDDIKI